MVHLTTDPTIEAELSDQAFAGDENTEETGPKKTPLKHLKTTEHVSRLTARAVGRRGVHSPAHRHAFLSTRGQIDVCTAIWIGHAKRQELNYCAGVVLAAAPIPMMPTPVARTGLIEASLLLGAERCIEGIKCGSHGLHRC